MKNLYTLMGRTAHKTHETERSLGSGFGKVTVLIFILFSISNVIYSQCTIDAYGQYGTLTPVCGSATNGAWATSATDCFNGDYSIVDVTSGSTYQFQTYRSNAAATGRFGTVATTANVPLVWGNTSTTTSITWTATFTGQVRFYTHLSNTCGTSTQTATRRVRCSTPISSACSGTPTPGNTLSSSPTAAPGGTVNLSLQNATSGTGVTYQWQSAPTSAGTWANIGGATASAYTATVTANTWYRCLVTCGGNTGTSNPVQVTLSYCSSTGTGGSYYINSFVTSGGVSNISNLNTGYSAGGYGNFTAQSCSQSAGSPISFVLTPNSDPSVQIYIDWNNDFDFDDAGEIVYSGGFLTSHSGNITVPAGQALGNYRMRIVHDWFNNPALGGACGSQNAAYRETEDYTFTVVAPPACSAPTGLTSSAITATGATISWAAASPAPASGYQYYVSTSSTAPTAGTTPTGTTAAGVTTASLTGLSGVTTYYFWVRSNCGGTGTSSWSISASFTTTCGLNAVVLNMFDTWGDGWNGATYTLVNNGTSATVATGTMSSGSSASVTFCLSNGCYQFSTSYDSYGEKSWNVSVNGIAALSGSSAASSDVLSVNSTCAAPWTDAWVSMNTGSSNWCAGETRTISVTVTNTGSSTWTNASPDINIGVKWNADADYFVRTDANGLAPGATQTYNLTVTAPMTTGTNNLTFDIVNELNFWFANNTNGSGPGNVVYVSPSLTIVALPTMNAGADQTVCEAASVTLTDAGSGATSLSWNNGISNGVAFNAPSSTTIYTVTGTNAAGCSATDQVAVTVKPLPVVNAGADQTICIGNSALLSGSITPSATTINLINETFEGAVFPPSGWSKSVTNALYTWGTTTGVAGMSGTSAQVNWNYTQNEKLRTPSVSLSNLSAASLTFDISMSYYWSVTPYNNMDVSVKVSTDGGSTWTSVWSEASLGAFATFQTYPITVDLAAYLGSNIIVSFEYVGNDAANLYLDNVKVIGTPIQAYSWTPSATLSNASIATPIATPNSTTTYTLTGTLNGCSSTDAVVVTLPTAGSTLANNNESATCVVNQNGWVHFYHSSGRLIGSINSQGQNLGSVTATSYVEGAPVSVDACTSSNPIYATTVMGRHWVITPTNQPTNPVLVRLPFRNAELSVLQIDAFNNANTNDDISSVSDVGLTKYSNGTAANVNNIASDNCGVGASTFHTQMGNNSLNNSYSNFAAGLGYYTDFSIPGFSEFWLHGSSAASPLPVELVSFQANCQENGDVVVTWATASEHNSANFRVEYSRDGLNWSALTTVAGAGNSTQLINYAVTDANAVLGNNYYRLVQTDYDGASETFNIVNANCGSNESTTTVKVYPNPSAGDFYIDFNSEEITGDGMITITDARGTQVYSKEVKIENGSNVFHVELDAAPGMYYIRVSNKTQTSNIVKHSLR